MTEKHSAYKNTAAVPADGQLTSMADIFATYGTPLSLGGNKPFLLDDPDEVRFVQEGRIEIFSTDLQDGRPVGARAHFQTVEQGGLINGMNLQDKNPGRGLLAVGGVRTKLRLLSRRRLLEIAAEQAMNHELARAVDGWLEGLSRGLSESVVSWHEKTALRLGPVTLEPDRLVRPNKGVAWVSVKSGHCLFLEMEEIPATGLKDWLPLTPETPIQSMSRVELVARPTIDVIDAGDLEQGLDLFYDMLLTCEALNRRLNTVDEFNRLAEKIEYSAAARARAQVRLAGVMEKTPESADIPDDDLLQAALSRVCRSAGIPFRYKPDPESDNLSDSAHKLRRAARASGFQIRPVRLESGWYKRDMTPVVAFLREGHRPVAVVPGPGRRCRIHDPALKEPVKVNKKTTEELEPTAYMVYPPLPTEASTFKGILGRYLHIHRGIIFGMLLSGLAAGFLSILTPVALSLVVREVIPSADQGLMNQIFGLLIACALAAAMFEMSRALLQFRLESKVEAELQAAFFDRLLKLPVGFFRNFTAGDLTDRVLGVARIREMIAGQTLRALFGVVFGLFHLAVLFVFDPILATVAVGLIIAAAAVTIAFFIIQLKYERTIAHLQGAISGKVLQFISAITKIRAAGAEPHAFADWANQFAEQRTHTYAAQAVARRLMVFQAVFPILATTGILLFTMGRTHELSSADFMALYLSFMTFITYFLTAGTTSLVMLQAVPVVERMRPILEAEPEQTLVKDDPGVLSGRLDVEQVDYRYHPDGPLVLHNLSMKIAPGEFTAVVGPSGSGKSTLVQLLLGFDAPEKGGVYYDGRDLNELDISSVRRQLGVVLQNSQITTGSILFNIIGSLPLTEDDAWEAARLADVAADIEQMPMGLHTQITGGAGTLSGGQRQRILIARALAAKAKILFFDEATSALDNHSQDRIRLALEELQVSRLVIAHRLSTIINADRIYVLVDGKIEESGTYEELMANKGVFSQMAQRQMVEQES